MTEEWLGPEPPRPPPPAVPDPLDGLPDPDETQSTTDPRIRTILEWVVVIAAALAVAVIIKTFLLQAFYIPSESMVTTLSEGDRVLVNKLSYRFGDVDRGDLVVFAAPEGLDSDSEDLIKRVIGLPGETVTFRNDRVYVDDRLLDEPYLGSATRTDPAALPIRHCANSPATDHCTVPLDRVFVMGDNRDHSGDSRVFGPIEEESIVGRAFMKIWPLSDLGLL